MKLKKVLVTGAAGFIGSHLVDFLIEKGFEVVSVDNLSTGKIENVNKNSKFYKANISNQKEVEKIMKEERPDIIFHLAAMAKTKSTSAGWKNPSITFKTNVLGTFNILNSLVKTDLDSKIVFASSAAIYGEPSYLPIDENHPTNPISPYGISKLAAEKVIKSFNAQFGIKYVLLRIFNAYGPRQSRYVMYDLIKKLKRNPKKLIVLGDGSQTRDYCFISDVVNGFYLASLKKKAENKIYNLGTGKGTSISELVNILLSELNLKNTQIIYKGKSWTGDIRFLVANINKIKRELGFKPKTNLIEGIRKLIKWMNAHSNSL